MKNQKKFDKKIRITNSPEILPYMGWYSALNKKRNMDFEEDVSNFSYSWQKFTASEQDDGLIVQKVCSL